MTAVVRGQRQTQEVSGGHSYLSAPEKTLTFGLGGSAKMDSLEIRWPVGTRETRRDIAPGAAVVLEQKAAGSRR